MIIRGREYPDVLLPYEVARLFGMSVKSLRRWEHEGLITRGITPGGHSRYHRDSVVELYAQRGGDPEDVPRPSS